MASENPRVGPNTSDVQDVKYCGKRPNHLWRHHPQVTLNVDRKQPRLLLCLHARRYDHRSLLKTMVSKAKRNPLIVCSQSLPQLLLFPSWYRSLMQHPTPNSPALNTSHFSEHLFFIVNEMKVWNLSTFCDITRAEVKKEPTGSRWIFPPFGLSDSQVWNSECVSFSWPLCWTWASHRTCQISVILEHFKDQEATSCFKPRVL